MIRRRRSSIMMNHFSGPLLRRLIVIAVAAARCWSGGTSPSSGGSYIVAPVRAFAGAAVPTRRLSYSSSSSSSSSSSTTPRIRFVTTRTFATASSSKSSAAAAENDEKDPNHSKHPWMRTTPSEDERPIYPKSRRAEMAGLSTASTASERPGAIIEDEQQLETKAMILQEIEAGQRTYDNSEWLNEVFGADTDIPDDDVDDDDDDDDAITSSVTSAEDADDADLDAERLGTWTIEDIRSKFDYEWDPNGNDPDPNLVSLNQPNVRYVETPPKSLDDPTVEQGYDPIFGPSSPIDRRTVLGAKDSYMVDPTTRDDTLLQPQFAVNDPELQFNQDVVELRQAMDIMETFIDPFLPDLEIPRHVAKWHGYPEMQYFEPKPFDNNRFTHSKDRTNFDQLDPYRARQRAVELARAKNAEWLPSEVSRTFHEKQRAPYESYQTLVGTLRKQTEPFDEDLLEQIQPALQVFGSSVELLSIHNGVFRFHYHGLMKNRHGMAAWMESLLKEECGVDPVTGVVMETGFRQRDPAYDGGDPWYAPIGS